MHREAAGPGFPSLPFHFGPTTFLPLPPRLGKVHFQIASIALAPLVTLVSDFVTRRLSQLLKINRRGWIVASKDPEGRSSVGEGLKTPSVGFRSLSPSSVPLSTTSIRDRILYDV